MNTYTAVVPVHNGERTIYEALCSISAQSIPPKRIVIFDNNSIDSTLMEVQRFRKTTRIPIQIERSKVLLPPHESFFHSILNVEGRFIWLAADDMLFSWSVEKLLTARCQEDCQHSIGGSAIFLNKDAELIPGKVFSSQLNMGSYLRDPADSSFIYGLHAASVVREYFPKQSFPAWDWSFLFQCVKDGVHFYGPLPVSLREYTPMDIHRANIRAQGLITRFFPYILLSKSILTSTSFLEKWKVLPHLLVLNLKGFVVFGKYSTLFDRASVWRRLTKLKNSIMRPLSALKRNSAIRAIFRLLPKSAQKLFRKTMTSRTVTALKPINDMTRLFENNGARYRQKMLSVNNPMGDFTCIPGENFNTAQILEMAIYFLRFASNNARLSIDLRNVTVNESFLDTVILGVKRIFPDGDIVFGPRKIGKNHILSIEEFYSKIWARDFSLDLDTAFRVHNSQKFKKSDTVNFFLPEIPQPNRDAGSIDAIYLLTILKRLGIKSTVYLPHFVSTNPLALGMLSELAELALVADFKNPEGLNLIYGPYAYQNFQPFSFENDFAYIMVDAVFRRAAQNKSGLSFLDRQILGYEAEALQNCKVALSISESDCQSVNHEFPSTNTSYFPIMRFPHQVSPEKPAPSNNLLFIGSLIHTPNRVAVEWIIHKLAPKLSAINPEITILLAGLGSDVYDRSASNVRGLGQVSDLNRLYAGSFATIAPMEIAAGINGKVVESLCFRVPALISEAVAVNLPKGLLNYCEIASNADEYAVIADKIFKNADQYASKKYQMKEVNGTLNIKTISKLVKEC